MRTSVRQRCPHLVCLVSVLMAAVFLTRIASAANYGVTELRPNGVALFPSAINAGGDTVGYFNFTTPSQELAFRAFHRAANGTVISIPLLANNPNDRVSSFAFAINDSGSVVGECQKVVDGPPQAFLFFAGNQLVDVGSRLGTAASRANGINAAGTIVGTMGDDVFFSNTAFAWVRPNGDPTGVVINLGPGAAYGVNSAGDVVGERRNGDNTYTPFLFRDVDGDNDVDPGDITLLATLGGGLNNTAVAINDAGVICGRSQEGAGANRVLPVRWANGSAAPQALMSAGGFPGGVAMGINAAGQIVGFGGSLGYLWDGATVVDLSASVPASSRFQVFEAFGINSQGQIAGNGRNFQTNLEMGCILAPQAIPANIKLRSLTIAPGKARPGQNVTFTIELTRKPKLKVEIPLQFRFNGVPVDLGFVPTVTLNKKQVGSLRLALPNLPVGVYTVVATLNGSTKDASLKVKPAVP